MLVPRPWRPDSSSAPQSYFDMKKKDGERWKETRMKTSAITDEPIKLLGCIKSVALNVNLNDEKDPQHLSSYDIKEGIKGCRTAQQQQNNKKDRSPSMHQAMINTSYSQITLKTQRRAQKVWLHQICTETCSKLQRSNTVSS